MNSPSSRAGVRHLLGSLLQFGALNAFGGGLYGMAGAKGVPTTWLEGSPFTTYFIPSVILLVVVGGSLLAAAIAVFTSWHRARLAAAAAALVLLGWICVQVAIMGYASWMQPATAAVAVALLMLGTLLRETRLSR